MERRVTRSMIAQQGSVEKISPIEQQQTKKKKNFKTKNVSSSEKWTRLQKKNFKNTGDTFGTQVQLDFSTVPWPVIPDNDQDGSDDEAVEYNSAENSDNNENENENESDGANGANSDNGSGNESEELYTDIEEEEPTETSGEAEVATTYKPQPETPSRSMLPLPSRQLPPVLRTRKRLQTTTKRLQPKTGIKTTPKPTRSIRPKRTPEDSEKFKYPDSEDEEEDEPKPSTSQLPSTGRVPPRLLKKSPGMVPSPTLHTRRTTFEKEPPHSPHDTQRMEKEAETEDSPHQPEIPKTPTKIHHEIPKTRNQGEPKKEIPTQPDVPKTPRSATIPSTPTLGKSTVPMSSLYQHVMEYFSISSRQTSKEELSTALNNVYADLLRAKTIVRLDADGALQGIKFDSNLRMVVDRAIQKREALLNTSTASGYSPVRPHHTSMHTPSAGPTDSTRPLRSNTKAPDIPPTSSVSLEHQLRQLEKKYQEKHSKKKEK